MRTEYSGRSYLPQGTGHAATRALHSRFPRGAVRERPRSRPPARRLRCLGKHLPRHPDRRPRGFRLSALLHGRHAHPDRVGHSLSPVHGARQVAQAHAERPPGVRRVRRPPVVRRKRAGFVGRDAGRVGLRRHSGGLTAAVDDVPRIRHRPAPADVAHDRRARVGNGRHHHAQLSGAAASDARPGGSRDRAVFSP